MKIKAIELFAGYGSQHLALKRLKRDYPNFDYEVVAFCEIDKDYFDKGCERFEKECKGIITTHNGQKLQQKTLFDI